MLSQMASKLGRISKSFIYMVSIFCFSVYAINENEKFSLGSPNPYDEQKGNENPTPEEYVLVNAKSDRYEFCSSAAESVKMLTLLAANLEPFESKDNVFSSLAATAGIDYPFLTVKGDADTYVLQQAIKSAWDNRHSQEKNMDSDKHPSQMFWNNCLSFSLDLFKQTWLDVLASCSDESCDE